MLSNYINYVIKLYNIYISPIKKYLKIREYILMEGDVCIYIKLNKKNLFEVRICSIIRKK